LRVAVPLLLVTGFTTLLRKTDLLFVGWMLDMRATGIYQAAVTVAAPVGFVLSAVNAVAAPRFARLHADNQDRKLHRFVRLLAHWLFWPTLAFSILIAVGAPFFLDIFGPEFETAQPSLFLLILSHLINAGSGSVGHLLNMTGHHLESARVYGITAGAHLVITPICIHYFGLWGAAVATTCSSLLWNAWLHYVVQKRLGLAPSILFAVRLLR
jgi:O-antigen/teichoic acid export membrane protein